MYRNFPFAQQTQYTSLFRDNNSFDFYRYTLADNGKMKVYSRLKTAAFCSQLQTLICRRYSLCWKIFLRGDYYSLFIQMLENCSASANSKLISGPLSICMKQAHLKPPQENDLIIFNYLEWAQGLEGSRYLGFPSSFGNYC